MDSACSLRISAPDTPCDSSEMSLQSGEIRKQSAPATNRSMDDPACRDTHRPAMIADRPAPPALVAAPHGSPAFKATVRGSTAKAPRGVGAVDRVGPVVAPVPLADGSETFRYIHPGAIFARYFRTAHEVPADSPETDMSGCYSPPRAVEQSAAGDSLWTRPESGRRSGSARGDRSRSPFRIAGTRSGDRRDVSLSPVPASQLFPLSIAMRHDPSRLRRSRVAWPWT
ncbi:hypothetical protein GGR40_001574 [Novosphingobium gossypii]